MTFAITTKKCHWAKECSKRKRDKKSKKPEKKLTL
jgi:hypothetical protein